MMTDKQLIARFLELQEYPEQATDEQLRQMLNDEQIHELVEQMAFTKRAFKNEETLTEELPIADEWEKFATAHAEELTNAARAEGKFTCTMPCKEEEDESQLDALDEENPKSRFALHFSTHKIAASFIGVILASGIAFAAIHIVRQYQKYETRQATNTIAVASRQSSTLNAQPEETDTLAAEPRIFDNVSLDTMLLEMADYYHVSVKFEREETRQLRFHFVWKRTDDLDRLVEKLNNFEAVNIIREPEKLIVK
ncbi:MAG: DUF4974 domain-containing protein [Prevotella sp.]|nr:DUF4974 domain-containing protein [Prevotella sp.]